MKSENITSESMALKVAEKGNKDLAESLVAEGGPLQCGALPEAEASRDDGKKNLLEAVTQSTTSTKKTKKGTKEKEAEALAPKKTIFEWGPHQNVPKRLSSVVTLAGRIWFGWTQKFTGHPSRI